MSRQIARRQIAVVAVSCVLQVGALALAAILHDAWCVVVLAVVAVAGIVVFAQSGAEH